MKIQGLCSIPANAKETGGALWRVFCSLFLVTTAVALSAVALVKADAVGAFGSPQANQGGSTSPKTMANLTDGANLLSNGVAS